MGENGGGGGGGVETPRGNGGSSSSSNNNAEKIFVSVRLRPLNGKEIVRNDVSDWECASDTTVVYKNGSLSGPERSMYPSAYTFDRVFGCDCSTRQVYEDGAKAVALSVVNGINASVFAYGQTSSGKTFTMTGITEYTLADIYDYVQKHTERDFHLKFSAMEIYNESVRDLLSSDTSPLRLLDDPERGTIVEKLTEETVRDWDHVMELLSVCEAQRQIGETCLNETSSRSHQIIRLTVESKARNYLGRESASTLVSTVDFVDLAGSERASQSLSAGARLKEGCHINRSLLTLGTVIRKLSKGRGGHIPFRDSKLTRILQSSLGGNARTAIICTMSPARSHVEQSRNTLLFASCAKEVSTNAQVNLVMSDKALVKHLQRELVRLESELRTPGSAYMTSDSVAQLREKDLQIEKMRKDIEELTAERDIARSQVQDLLHLVGNDGGSLIRLRSGDYPHLRVKRSPESENYMREPSIVDHPSLDESIRTYGSSRYSPRQSQCSSDDTYIEMHELDEKSLPDSTPLRPVIRNSDSSEIDSCHGWDDDDGKSNGTSQELCKVVRCIETDDFSSKGYVESYFSSPDEKIGIPTVRDFGDNDSAHQESVSSKGEFISSDSKEDREANKLSVKEHKEVLHPQLKEEKLVVQPSMKEDREELKEDKTVQPPSDEEDKEVVELLVKEDSQLESTPNKDRESNYIVPHTINFPENQSQWNDLPQDFPGSLNLSKSSSFKESTPSTWVKEVENRMPPNGYEREYAAGPLGLLMKISSLDSAGEFVMISRNGSKSSQGTINHNDVEAQESISKEKEEEEEKEDVSNTNSFTAATEVPAESQNDEQVQDSPAEEAAAMTTEPLKSVKDVALDPIEDDCFKAASWPLEFKRLQRDIIELWHACKVSLVHRTYFFLLFKGDPTDSIYMEVELRRLTFLKDAFARGNQAVEDGSVITPSSSEKALRREREMLTKQMQKKLTEQERESLYLRWGVGLSSKYRRIQLVNRLWSKTDDMDHIADSAVVVAKLVGFITDPGQTPKEMFGLNFARWPSKRSYSFKRSLLPLL